LQPIEKGPPAKASSPWGVSPDLRREIAARTKPRFIEIPRERRRSVAFTGEQLTAMRGGLTAEE
jgi:hypothetical protein